MTKSRVKRSRTFPKYVYYAFQLYSSGLSIRKRLSDHLLLSEETISQSEIGFNDRGQRGYISLE